MLCCINSIYHSRTVWQSTYLQTLHCTYGTRSLWHRIGVCGGKTESPIAISWHLCA